MTGRARGRGVARGRGAPPSAGSSAAPPRRPGTGPAPQAQQVPAQPIAGGEPAVNGTSGNGAGRASSRGGARGENRPGAGVADLPVTGMAQLSLGTGDARRERRVVSYRDPETKPAHITDKKGTSGRPLPLKTNYYAIEAKNKDWQLYQYVCEFDPPIDSRKLRKGLVGEHADRLFRFYLFDGMHLYSATKLADEVTEFVATRKYDDERIRVSIKRVSELAPYSETRLHVYNVMMRQILADLEMKEVQRAYFSPKGAVVLRNHNLEIWPGFKTSILQYEDQILLNLDISHKVLRTDSVLDTLYLIYNNCGKDFNRLKDLATKQLVGEIVMTRYNDKTYRIDDIAWNIHPTNTFQKRGEDVTYRDYYKNAYGVEIHDNQQPMLVSRCKRRDQREGAPELLYLLPELCTRTGLDDGMRANFNLMKDMGKHTRLDPNRRHEKMHVFRQSIDQNSKATNRLTGWGMQYSRDLVTLTGRQLPSEVILLGSKKTATASRQADWGGELRGNLYTTVPVANWVVVYSRQHEPVLQNFFNCINRVAPPMGIQFAPPKKAAVENTSIAAFLDAIRSTLDRSVQLILIVLPTNKKDMYDAIKKQCCVEAPVVTQCVTFNTLKKDRGLMSVVSKIVIQINCKLAGEAWALDIPLKSAMVVGIDTYHDSSKKGRSVGGFVASLNKTFTRYYSETIFQSSMQELIDGLKLAMNNALKKYHAVNGSLPNRIIVYRDGVGDGQLPVVVEHEVNQIIAGTLSLGKDYKPMVTVIVVKKRISTKFFAPGDRGSLANPPPGTVVDNTVTKRESYDFFLVSQSVNQGTVTPSHYNVIWDTSNLQPDHIQKLTYKLCHLYYNWPGTIRVPAPCQYAHKLAFLTGQSLHRSPHESLSDKLFFL